MDRRRVRDRPDEADREAITHFAVDGYARHAAAESQIEARVDQWRSRPAGNSLAVRTARRRERARMPYENARDAVLNAEFVPYRSRPDANAQAALIGDSHHPAKPRCEPCAPATHAANQRCVRPPSRVWPRGN